jgi:hypothetical protein
MAADRAARERQLAEERAIEDARRREVIMQIQALERVPVSGAAVKVFDPTTTPGYGLLDEMSLVQLRERLQLLQERESQEREEKRQAILSAKEEKEAEVQRKLDFISRLRTRADEDAKERFAIP